MSMARTRDRGRGLASLIPESALDSLDSSTKNSLRMVPIDELRANPNQPREVFQREQLEQLADSIRAHGILSPLVARKVNGNYFLIAGERRLRAAGLAGLQDVPVVIRDADTDHEQLELALVENLQRADLDPIEAARGYQRLIEEYTYTQDEVARRVGKERPTIANALRLLKLPEFILEALRQNYIAAGHARALLPLDDDGLMRKALGQVVDQQLSVRATEKLVTQLLKGKSKRKTAPKKDAYVAVTKRLCDTLHTKVSVRSKKNGSGSIVIDYNDAEEFERLVGQLGA